VIAKVLEPVEKFGKNSKVKGLSFVTNKQNSM